MAEAIVGKIERKFMAHYIDTAFAKDTTSTVSPSWYRIGEDLEEYSVELNPDTEVVKNILGNTKFNHNGYEPTADADPFYARVGDPLFVKLQDIVDSRHQGDQCKTSALEVHLWDNGDTSDTGYSEDKYVAYRQFCYCVPTSYGGDTSGYQIPFSVNYVGDRIKGKFQPNSTTGGGTFTPDT